MRDIAALPDIAAQDRRNVLEWIGIADDWLDRYVPGHAAHPVEEPTSLPELGHLPGARPQAADLTAEQRAIRISTIIAAHGRRLSEHVEEAAAVHLFDAEGWDELETDLRNFLLFPSISDDDRALVEERIAEIDRARQELAARAEATERISALVARHDAHLQRHIDAAQSAGIHPFEAEGWDELETDLRNFLLLPSISDDDRALVEERIAEIDRVRQEFAARAEARRLYTEHIERHDSYMETLHNTLDPSEIDIRRIQDNLRERGLSLLKLPGLADADRDNIERTYDMNQLAKNITVHRRRRNDLLFEAERSPYRHFSRHLARHLEAAEAQNLHPYAAPGCDRIADLADKTLRNDRLTGEQHDRIRPLPQRLPRLEERNEPDLPVPGAGAGPVPGHELVGPAARPPTHIQRRRARDPRFAALSHPRYNQSRRSHPSRRRHLTHRARRQMHLARKEHLNRECRRLSEGKIHESQRSDRGDPSCRSTLGNAGLRQTASRTSGRDLERGWMQ